MSTKKNTETSTPRPPIIHGHPVIGYNGKGNYLPRCIECFANSDEGLNFLTGFRPLDQEKWNPKETKEKFLKITGLENCLNLCNHTIDSVDSESLWNYLDYCYDVRNMFSIYSDAYIAYDPKSSS